MDGSSRAAAVRPFESGDAGRWDEFIRGCADATFFHLSAWRRVIERAFGHRTHYLLAERGGVVTGVLPLTHVKSPLFGSSLISNAFAVHGGPVAADEDSRRALEQAAARLMDRLGVGVLELRGFSPGRAGWPQKSGLYANFRKPIAPAVAANLKAIPRKQRAMVRKGIDGGLRSEIDHHPDRLHRIYAESVRNLGTPVFAKSYFEILLQEFADRCDIVTITSDGAAVASVLNFYFRDEVLPFYGGGTTVARQLAANDFLYWEVMRRACERGCRVFDFGRSKLGTGAYAFKCHWGFAPTPLVYQFRLGEGRDVPDLNPLNPKLRFFVSAWKKLPLPLANRLGPLIVKGIG
ncbi:MAG TPA: FemAB family XrtA/PEP-CTERM system-associated protein [Stellaceae bacterium]|nr:FemAB family XrtA/PEP-CTERM system-associated protein [Stellaceae bacterium]